MKTIRWVLFNGIFAVLMWFALSENKQWASNALIFMVNLQAFASIMILLSGDLQKDVRAKGRTAPEWMTNSFGICAAIIFASQGWFWSALVMMIELIAMSISHEHQKAANHEG